MSAAPRSRWYGLLLTGDGQVKSHALYNSSKLGVALGFGDSLGYSSGMVAKM